MSRARDLANIADGDITGTLTLDDIVLSNDMSVADNGKVQFGAGSDLQILHDGSNSIVQDTGTGNLLLKGRDLTLQDYNTGEPYITCVNNGAVTAYYDNAAKLATKSDGVDITGELQADSLDIDGTVDIDGATFITTTGNGATLTLESTDDDSNQGPLLTMFRNSASPADSDLVGKIAFTAEDSAGNETGYAIMQSRIRDVTDGTEDGELRIDIRKGGTVTESLTMKENETVFNEAGVDTDFRVESDGQTHAFFVDAGNNSVHIGDSTDYGGKLNIVTANNDPQLVLVSTDADSNFGPKVSLYRNSSSPADDDFLGIIEFDGENSAGETTTYAQLFGRAHDVTDGTEDGRVAIKIIRGGTLKNVLDIIPNEIVLNQDSQNISFRVESDNKTHALFVRGSDGFTGVGTTSPNAPLQAQGVSTNDNVGAFIVYNDNTDNNACIAAFATGSSSTSTSNVLLRFGSDFYASGQGMITAAGSGAAAFAAFSDRTLKENIADLPSQLANIMALRPVEFDYIESQGGGHQIGFIAQDVETIYPDLVGENDDGIKMLAGFDKTTARLVKALQEAIAKIETLETKVAALEAAE